jgi:membrane protease YdiL (CAAX protease family)
MAQLETEQPGTPREETRQQDADPARGPSPVWARATDPPERRELWWQLGVALAVGVVPHLLRAILSLFEPRSEELGSAAISIYVTVTSLSIVMVMLYLVRQSREPRRDFGLVWSLKADPAMAVAVFIANLIVYVLLSSCFVSLIDPQTWNVPSTFKGPRGPAEFAIMVVSQLANATSEELVIWGVIFTRLVKLRGSPWSSAVLAATAFASYHVYQGLYAVVIVFGLGLCHGAIFLGIRRLWPLVLAHALWDIILFAQM